MSKVFVEVVAPGNGKTYEFQLESRMTGAQAIRKIVEEILEVEQGGIGLRAEDAILLDMECRCRISGSAPLFFFFLKSGHTLMVI